MATEATLDALKAIAHPLRLQILRALADGERNVGEIEQETGIGQPALSQQLAVLRKAGLVDTRREAKLVYYSLRSQALADAATTISEMVPQSFPEGAGKGRPAAKGAANFARMLI